MRRNANYEVKSMYASLIRDLKPRIGKYTKYNTEITEEMIEVLENRLLELKVGELI